MRSAHTFLYLNRICRILAATRSHPATPTGRTLPPPHVAPPGMRTHPVGTRTHRTHANVPCVDRQAGDGVLDVGHCCVRCMSAPVKVPPAPRARAACKRRPALTTCICKHVRGAASHFCTTPVCVSGIPTVPLPHVASHRAGAAVTGCSGRQVRAGRGARAAAQESWHGAWA